jgi:acetate---CoA ligase (ADP-forming)
VERPLKIATAPARDLRALFDPSTVAIVGASATVGKWGHWLARNALLGKERRRVYLVNRSGIEILGQRSFTSLREVPEPPELVVISIGAGGFEQAVDEALTAGARAIVGITAGRGEMGGASLEADRRLAETVRAAGAVLVGPNCLGVADTGTGLNVAFGEFTRGPMAVVSQSGNIALELTLVAAEHGLGVSRFVSLGNQSELTATELIDALAGHEATRVIAAYVEDFGDGRAFANTALRAAAAGKPVVLLTVGSSGSGARAARSHTGALVSASVAVDAACRAGGMMRVATPHDAIDLALGLVMPHPPRGRRVGVVGDGGGHLALAADLMTESGLTLPRLSDELSSRIAATLPPNAATGNPVDLAGGGEQDQLNYVRVVEALAGSGEVDSVLLTGYFGGYSEDDEQLARTEREVARALVEVVERTRRPLLVHSMYPSASTFTDLRAAGVPVYGDTRSAATVLCRLVERAAARPTGAPVLPPPPPAGGPVKAGYFDVRRLFAAAGIDFPDAREVTDLEGALDAAASIGYPVALKADGADHKSDAGGVRLGIGGADELKSALAAMPPNATYSVERMVHEGGVELLIGVRWDHAFGPVLVSGAGGLFAELVHDVAVALAPVSEDEAEALIRTLRIAPMLLGHRGKPPLDVAAAARAAAALSNLAASRPDIAEVEINPLLVTATGAIALDARIVTA